MFKLILKFGVIGGLIVAVPMVWRMVTLDAGDSHDPLGGMVLGYLTMLVALTTVFLGIKQYRDKFLGGAIRFLPALGVGLAISTVACVLYVIGWEISMAYSEFDFTAFYTNYMVEAAKAKGGTPEELAKAVAEAQAFAESYRNPLVRMPMTFVEMFPVGLLVSLISAAVLRNSRVLPARQAA
jgi:hypothetical protein